MPHPIKTVPVNKPLASSSIPLREDVITVSDEAVHVCRRLVQLIGNAQSISRPIRTPIDPATQAALCDALNDILSSMVEIVSEFEQFVAIVDSAEISVSDLERIRDLLRSVLTTTTSQDLTREAVNVKNYLEPVFKRKGLIR